MKYIRRTKEDIRENFLVELLKDREIIGEDEDYNRQFFYPSRENLLAPLLLDNMDEGFQMFKKHLEAGSKILVPWDPDLDGVTSASTLINYMNDNLKELYPNFTIDYHSPHGKEHGLDTIVDELIDNKQWDLIILADSSSNDYEEHKMLKEVGYDVLCLDHHQSKEYSEDAIVINNQLSQYYENKELTGVGVVYKFLQYCDIQFNLNAADDYLDLVATGIIGDMAKTLTLENRYICDKGLSNLRNFGLRQLVKQQGYSIFGVTSDKITDEFLDNARLTPIQISFYIAPLVNALIRVGSEKDKENLFKSFLDGTELVESTKRGHKGEIETLAEQAARNCTNARTKQNKDKDKAIELLDIQISNDCLDDNKILILNADEIDVSNTLTGLCAMGVVAKYKKPTILGRVNSEGYLKGSIRGCNGSELKDFRQFLLDSGLMDYVEG